MTIQERIKSAITVTELMLERESTGSIKAYLEKMRGLLIAIRDDKEDDLQEKIDIFT